MSRQSKHEPEQPYSDDPLGPGPRNGAGTAALVLGILTILGAGFLVIEIHGAATGISGPVPIGAQLRAFLFGVPAVATGIIGRRRAQRGDASNGASAVTGLAAGLAGIAVNIVAIVLAGSY